MNTNISQPKEAPMGLFDKKTMSIKDFISERVRLALVWEKEKQLIKISKLKKILDNLRKTARAEECIIRIRNRDFPEFQIDVFPHENPHLHCCDPRTQYVGEIHLEELSETDGISVKNFKDKEKHWRKINTVRKILSDKQGMHIEIVREPGI